MFYMANPLSEKYRYKLINPPRLSDLNRWGSFLLFNVCNKITK